MRPSSLIAISHTIKECERHLNTTNAWNTEIESYLTKFLLVFICGEYEKEIELMINARADVTGDEHIASFIRNLIHPLKWIRIGEIRGQILGRFSNSYKLAFDAEVNGTLAEQYYTNIVNNRMESAHGGIVQMTFKELKNSYKEADKILTTLSRILKVKREFEQDDFVDSA